MKKYMSYYKYLNWTLSLLHLILNTIDDTPDIHNNLGPEITDNNGRYLPLDYRWYLMYRISQHILAQRLYNEALAAQMPTEFLLVYGGICLVPVLFILFKGVYSNSPNSSNLIDVSSNDINIEDS